ncbi:unnamed protein product [Lactuca virosa]|uniref:JAB1/MPN/MOV34 metalloenzyme domain-containing protein n=1 Tax=Lactuca virosa TaxID=75947 RepID=A0AAU9LGI3_9ASTR|nr:unnamed protein product [Lactuca virosa]
MHLYTSHLQQWEYLGRFFRVQQQICKHQTYTILDLGMIMALWIPQREHHLEKQELYKKVFPNFYILGWYSTGADAEESDMHIHKALMDINESPVYVLLNPLINHAQKDLLVNIYESELHVIDGISQLIFVRSSYTIETVETERIYVDHVAHLKPSDLVELQPPLLYGLYNVKNIEGGNLRQPSLRSQQVPRLPGMGKFLRFESYVSANLYT